MSQTTPESEGTTPSEPVTEPTTVAPPTPGAPSDVPTVDPTPVPEPAAEDVATGYAVYDKTLGQYVSGVQVTKGAADKIRKDGGAEGHEYVTIRV
jgi:hypothetical protein